MVKEWVEIVDGRSRMRYTELRPLRAIPGFSGYLIDEIGRVWTAGAKRLETVESYRKGTHGSYVVRLCKDGKYYIRSVAKLMLEIWGTEPKLSPKHKAMHLDHCLSNNRIDNLYWGVPVRGPALHHRAKLTGDQVLTVEQRLRLKWCPLPPDTHISEVEQKIMQKKNSNAQIAADFGVSPATISNIKKSMPENNPSEKTIQGIRERIGRTGGGTNEDIIKDYNIFPKIVDKMRDDIAEEKIIAENQEF